MLKAIARFKGAITQCHREDREISYRTKGLVESGLCLSLSQQIQLLTVTSVCQLY